MAPAQNFFRAAALGLIIAATSCPADTRVSASENIPFTPGEKLHYSIYWAGIKAAEATLEVMPMTALGATPAWHFVMTAKTTGLAAAIYPLHDHIHSWTDTGITRALHYTENSRKRFRDKHIDISFDWNTATAHSVKNGKQNSVALKPGSFDPLSIFYFFRMQKLRENAVLKRFVADRKRCLKGVVNVRGRQKVISGGREWDSWLVEPDLRQIEGVYEKHPDAQMQIWVSADERRIPVKVSSKVTLGTFTAELDGIEIPQATPCGQEEAQPQPAT